MTLALPKTGPKKITVESHAGESMTGGLMTEA